MVYILLAHGRGCRKRMDLQRQLGGRAVIVRLSKELRIHSKKLFLLCIRSSLESGVDMKTNQIVSRCILAGIFLYLLFQIYYLSCGLLPSVAGETLKSVICLLIAQSALFAAAVFSIFIVSVFQYWKKKRYSPFEAMLLISGEGKVKSEILLQGKSSLMVTGRMEGREVFIESDGEAKEGRYLYGICNLVCGSWYFEAAPGSRPVGLKRGMENRIYRLKEEIPYRLSEQDVLYADTCKIVIRQ